VNDGAAIRDILDFWLLPARRSRLRQGSASCGGTATPELDAEIKASSARCWEKAAAGQLDHWANSPDGALALILLLRPVSRATSTARPRRLSPPDAKARESPALPCRASIRRPSRTTCGSFFYMPFQHSEHLGDQELCCALFQAMGSEDNDKHAFDHRDIVAKSAASAPQRGAGPRVDARGTRIPEDR